MKGPGRMSAATTEGITKAHEERWAVEWERNSENTGAGRAEGKRFLHNAGEDGMVRQAHGGTRLATMPPELTPTPHVGTLPYSIGSGSPPTGWPPPPTRAGKLHYGPKRLSCRGGREPGRPPLC